MRVSISSIHYRLHSRESAWRRFSLKASHRKSVQEVIEFVARIPTCLAKLPSPFSRSHAIHPYQPHLPGSLQPEHFEEIEEVQVRLGDRRWVDTLYGDEGKQEVHYNPRQLRNLSLGWEFLALRGFLNTDLARGSWQFESDALRFDRGTGFFRRHLAQAGFANAATILCLQVTGSQTPFLIAERFPRAQVAQIGTETLDFRFSQEFRRSFGLSVPENLSFREHNWGTARLRMPRQGIHDRNSWVLIDEDAHFRTPEFIEEVIPYLREWNPDGLYWVFRTTDVAVTDLVYSLARGLQDQGIFTTVETFQAMLAPPSLIPLTRYQIHAGPRFYRGILAYNQRRQVEKPTASAKAAKPLPLVTI